MRTGTIVKLKVDHMQNGEGSRGICFHKSEHGVYSGVMFENGFCDMLTQDEQLDLLTPVNIDIELANYKFKNLINTMDDFYEGVFNVALGKEKTS